MFDYPLNKLPPSVSGTFTVNCDRPNTCPTRQSKLYFIPQCHSVFMRKQPRYFLPVLWDDWAKLIMSLMQYIQKCTFPGHFVMFTFIWVMFLINKVI